MPSDLADVRFLTVAEVADMMRVSKMTVYRLVHSGELPAIRFGRSFRVPESAVRAAVSPTTTTEAPGSVADAG
jgi:excisionase family DNA binding protein